MCIRDSRYWTCVAQFSERFILPLGSYDDFLVPGNELNVLPISRKKISDLSPIHSSEVQLRELRESLEDTKPAGDLTKLAKTIDQAQAILTFIDAIAEKTLSSTVTLTAGRGRGKSAALGLYVRSPSNSSNNFAHDKIEIESTQSSQLVLQRRVLQPRRNSQARNAHPSEILITVIAI